MRKGPSNVKGLKIEPQPNDGIHITVTDRVDAGFFTTQVSFDEDGDVIISTGRGQRFILDPREIRAIHNHVVRVQGAKAAYAAERRGDNP